MKAVGGEIGMWENERYTESLWRTLELWREKDMEILDTISKSVDTEMYCVL